MKRWMPLAVFSLFTSLSLSLGACASSDELSSIDGPAEEEEVDTLEESVSTPKSVTTGTCTNQLSFENEMLVTDPKILDSAEFHGAGKWSFGGIVSQLTGADAPKVVRKWLGAWEGNASFTPPGGAEEVVPGNRKNVHDVLIDGWQTTASGDLDLADAPFRLLAIVYRPDLDDLAKGGTNPGEIRFVFGGEARGNRKLPIPMTVAFEFEIPAANGAQAAAFAAKWHAALHPLYAPSTDAARVQYRAVLLGLMGTVLAQGPSALRQLRTNEVAIDTPWDLREFHLVGTPGSFALAIAATPGVPLMKMNGTDALAGIVDGFAAYVQTYAGSKVPKSKETAMARVPTREWSWKVPGVSEKDRHAFAMSTCNGCHSSETKTHFLQIQPRSEGQRAELSPFLRSTKEKPHTVDGHTFTVQDDRLEAFNAHLAANGTCEP